MAIDAQQAALLVRVTARVSAAIVAADLVTAARRAARPGSAALRTADMATFVAFLASHTVHFVCVLLLAAATGGENIRNSGGWVLVVMAALMFYGGAGMVVRVKLRRLAQPPRTPRRTRLLVILWLVFFQAYALSSLRFLALRNPRPAACVFGCRAAPGRPKIPDDADFFLRHS